VLVFDFPLIVCEMCMPDGLFGFEMVNSVVGKFAENAIQFCRVLLVSKSAREQVDQMDESFVLFIDQRDAGGKIIVPRENFNRFIHQIHNSA